MGGSYCYLKLYEFFPIRGSHIFAEFGLRHTFFLLEFEALFCVILALCGLFRNAIFVATSIGVMLTGDK